MFSWIKRVFKTKSDREFVEEYLSKSVSLVDLERRQRELAQRGYFV